MNGDAMFFDSMKGDRIYNAADFREWLHRMFSEGVSVNDFFVSPAGGMSLTVPGGYVHIRGASKTFTTDTTVTLETSDQSLNRIDAVVLELDISKKTIDVKTVKGAAADNSVKPEPIRNDNVWQMVLAYINVNAGASEITEADIVDARMDRNKCGYLIRSACDNDMSEVIRVYEEEIANIIANTTGNFSAWFEQQKEAFSQDIASQINEISEKIILKKADVNSEIQRYSNDVAACAEEINAAINASITPTSTQHVSSLYPWHWSTTNPNFNNVSKAPSVIIARIKIAKEGFAGYSYYSSYLNDFYVTVILRRDTSFSSSNTLQYVGNFNSAVYETNSSVYRTEIGGTLRLDFEYDLKANKLSFSYIDSSTKIKSIYFRVNGLFSGSSANVIADVAPSRMSLKNAILIWDK